MIPRFHRPVCDLYGAIGVKGGINSILFDLTATISSSRPNFPWPLRAAAVKGGRRPSRNDIPLIGSERLGGLSLAVGVEWRPSPISRRQPATLRNRGAPCVRVFPEGHTRGVDSGGTGERHARAFLLIH